MRLFFVVLLVPLSILTCSPDKSIPPTAPVGKANECSMLDVLNGVEGCEDYKAQDGASDEATQPDSETETETEQEETPADTPATESEEPEQVPELEVEDANIADLHPSTDLNGDGHTDDSELEQIELFQNASREIAANIVKNIPDMLVAGRTDIVLKSSTISTRNQYDIFGTAIRPTSSSSRSLFLARNRRKPSRTWIIGTNLSVEVRGRNISISGEFADAARPFMVQTARHLSLSLNYALSTAFDNFSIRVPGEHGGSLSIKGDKTSTWTFDGFSPRRGVSISGIIGGVQLDRGFPVRVTGHLYVQIRTDLARGKISGIRPGQPKTEPPIEIDYQNLLSVDKIPALIPPLYGIEIRLDLKLHQQEDPTGTLKAKWYDNTYGNLGVSYDIRDLLDNSNQRFVYYYMPSKTRAELIGEE